MERRGAAVSLLSTRPPPAGLIAHRWSAEAMARTTYLASADPRAGLAALGRAPLTELARELRTAGRPFLRDVAMSLPAARRLVRLAAARGIGHVHVHSCGRAALIAALARRMGGPRYSLTLHGPLSDYGPGQAFKWRHAAFATVITQTLLAEARAALGRDMPDRVLVQPMGVDVDSYRRDRPYAPPTAGAPLRIFACGRLNVVKGHADLLQAVALLRARGVDARLEIAGEDDAGGHGYHPVLQARLEELGLAEHATLLGAIDAGEVRQRLVAADLFVLASWHEPLGVAYMEAMACGVPTIGTDAGGVRELIRDGRDGLLVPPRDPETLADAIAALAADPDRCAALSRQGRLRIEESFSSARGAELLLREAARTASA
ncbi:glycosyltransferase [Aquicoccus sp. SCR17]|nr:glycosyltransferase [Carideicomes alvinocaridis]